MSNPYNNHRPFDLNKGGVNNENKLSSFNKPEGIIGTPTIENTFYTNPVNTFTNNQSKVVKYLYPNPSYCRDTGYLCGVKHQQGRLFEKTIYDDEKYNSLYKLYNE